ncbi:MAG: mechanosensitive ion channel family protein [Treponema sp.]|jgi:small-conductance mechanosensitive channel|nr:mechanosensitive ion channel family protein [Treponema sp.]
MNPNDFIKDIEERIIETNPSQIFVRAVSALLMAFVIIMIFNLLQLLLGRALKKKLSEQRSFILRKGIKYTGIVIALLFVFRNMGIDTSALLGAAGVVGIVLGFAAQTTVASCISGFFLISEKPFKVGDAIQVDTLMGVVMSVDLLSVKLRTFDNLFVRIPNETIIKANLVTLTRYAIRRLDLSFSVAYKTNLDRAREVLMDLAAENTYVLDNPAPLFRVDKFDERGVGIIMSVWFDRNFVLETKTSVLMDIKRRFDEECIELTYRKVDIGTVPARFSEESFGGVTELDANVDDCVRGVCNEQR